MKNVLLGCFCAIIVFVAGCTPLENALAQSLFNAVFGL